MTEWELTQAIRAYRDWRPSTEDGQNTKQAYIALYQKMLDEKRAVSDSNEIDKLRKQVAEAESRAQVAEDRFAGLRQKREEADAEANRLRYLNDQLVTERDFARGRADQFRNDNHRLAETLIRDSFAMLDVLGRARKVLKMMQHDLYGTNEVKIGNIAEVIKAIEEVL